MSWRPENLLSGAEGRLTASDPSYDDMAQIITVAALGVTIPHQLAPSMNRRGSPFHNAGSNSLRLMPIRSYVGSRGLQWVVTPHVAQCHNVRVASPCT